MPDDPRPEPEAAAEPCYAPPEGGVSLAGVSQSYGSKRVLREIDLTVEQGGFLALVGPSGCGKSTLLKLLAGLLDPDAGVIRIGGQIVADPARRRFVAPERRDLGMVFQDYALWPHLRVADNVGFPLEMRGVTRAERRMRVAEALDQVGLAGFGERFPGQLSGGQQQRVALARAIVARPKLILFDEPLSNLDQELRDALGVEIAALCRSLNLTALYVTHDLGEAFALADRIAVMRDGALLQIGAPEQLVADPASASVAEFLKLGAIMPARLEAGYIRIGDTIRLPPPNGSAADGPGALLLPTRALAIAAPGKGDLGGVVVRRLFHGTSYEIEVRVAADAPLVHIVTSQSLALGSQIGIALDAELLRWFPAAI
jgi:iron(III) transport system ATP-binding protein